MQGHVIQARDLLQNAAGLISASKAAILSKADENQVLQYASLLRASESVLPLDSRVAGLRLWMGPVVSGLHAT